VQPAELGEHRMRCWCTADRPPRCFPGDPDDQALQCAECPGLHSSHRAHEDD
ncbi:unnamed protein product, partial [Symbiodinium microadriaticum]